MFNNIGSKKIFLICCMTIGSLFIVLYFTKNTKTSQLIYTTPISFTNDNIGWITSSSLYKEMNLYIKSIRNTNEQHIFQGKRSLNYNYIKFIKKNTWNQYPFSTRKCSNTSNQELSTGIEYCLLTNIYYNSAIDQYYYYQNPADIQIITKTIELDVSYGKLTLNILNDILEIKKLIISSVLIRPIYVGGPIDPNYAHGLLETFGPRFWVLSELQSNGLFIDSSQFQIYYTSHMFDTSIHNWRLYVRQSDGTYRDAVKWSATIQSMFSDYPLLIYKSFNETTVMFKYFITTGNQVSRTPAWDFYYSVSRSFRFHPFHTRQYRRNYLAYSEWLLKNLNLPSKFQLTAIQEQLQQNHMSEIVPICDPVCKSKWSKSSEYNEKEFTGDWIVVINRAGSGRREITNADELVDALLKVFPDHTNPYLRVWPKQFNFKDDLYKTAQMARSIRLMIGVHGAGLANTIFMRPGTILYEINPIGCRKLSFNFHRWATIFNLQHALWSPSQKGFLIQDDACQNRQEATTLVVSEIVKEVVNLIENEQEYRNGYIRRALHLLNDTSLIDHPQIGLEKI
ncbi:unnamed protein product [Adineta steineri]|uniref:EGF domain-specific O-linked N-acetylglucosamine transferase n=1 Tax=Adineta steineri TaxID=433720 RepID=A0A819M5U9_9BILA|nr:unnamed protein product [Adineta steineri]CAF3974140.1 unnamed protein product [Adineta steineri]